MPHTEKPSLTPPLGPSDHVLGPRGAPLLVLEFGDFECPACEQAFTATRMLRHRYENKMQFAFRHFPMREVHPHAELAAEACEAAGAQGKFWEMEALLFKNYPHLKPRALRSYAEELELDMIRYDAELADHVYLQRIQEHIESGRASGVRNTPTFFVNGQHIDVSFGIEHLVLALEALERSH